MTDLHERTTAAAGRPASHRWWGLAVIGLAQLMVMLDTTIVNIALPWAQRATGMSDADRQWVITGYTLAFGGLLLLGGRIGDLLGRRLAFIIAVTGFTAASAVGGAAPNAAVLIGSRVGQGLFAALLMPATLALLTTTFTEPRERAKAFGIFSSVASAGGALGLLGGGLITEWLNWRWCLYVNVPIGALVVAGALMLLPNLPAQRGVKVDVPGAALSAAGMVALVYGFGEAADHGWSSARVIGLLAAAVVLLTAFVALQARGRNPLLPLSVLADRDRAGAFIGIGLTMIGLFGLMFILTYQLQGVMDYSPLRTGLAILPATVATVLTTTQITSRLMPKVPVRLLVTPGMLIAAAGLFNLGRITPDSSYVTTLMPTQILVGLGLGLVMSPCISLATHKAAPSEVGVVSAFVSTSQQIGGSVGTALLNTIAMTVSATALSAAGTDAHAAAEATVHGYAVAADWAGAIVLAGAVLTGLLIGTDLRKPAAAPATPAPQSKQSEPSTAH
ncbi:DHA2 family efflux MFS transporter permease subunit [Streptomyces sp. NPDC020298]|uniref:DHA2 family efflux MFS transporter permease subunit n=1 Tax=Streptomyces sp. NPDC020298 TaxID=3155010 RepID=UPI0033CFCD6D